MFFDDRNFQCMKHECLKLKRSDAISLRKWDSYTHTSANGTYIDGYRKNDRMTKKDNNDDVVDEIINEETANGEKGKYLV